MEFSGPTLDETADIVAAVFSGRVSSETSAEKLVCVDNLGDFRVEIDWDLLKQEARDENLTEEQLRLLTDLATRIVPIEVVCPPLDITELDRLEVMITALAKQGARGTQESLLAAFGVHINTEIPDLKPETIQRYLKAFALLQSWLLKTDDVDLSRRITPYIDLYPDDYVTQLIKVEYRDVDTLIEDYIKFNPTRNRALDMLPMFMHVAPARVKEHIDDNRIKARPTFHYRLPNCLIGKPGWSLATAWQSWWLVEEVAENLQLLEKLAGLYLHKRLQKRRPLFGMNDSKWVKTVDLCLKESKLV